MKQLAFTLLLFTNAFTSAQNAFKKGDHVMTFGYGFPSYYATFIQQDMEDTEREIKSRIVRSGSGSFSYSRRNLGPFFLKYDLGISNKLGLGIVLAYCNPTVTETLTYTDYFYGSGKEYHQSVIRDIRSLTGALKLNYHFGERRKFDPYVGIGIGFTNLVVMDSYTTDEPNVLFSSPPVQRSLHPYLGATLGLRAYITSQLGIYGELGWEKWALMQAGITLKFPK